MSASDFEKMYNFIISPYFMILGSGFYLNKCIIRAEMATYKEIRNYFFNIIPSRVPHWSVIEHRTRKQDIEPGNYTTQNLENMADLHGEI